MDLRLYAAINGLAGRSPVLDDLGIAAAKYGPYLFMALLVALWFWPGTREARRGRQVTGAIAAASAAVALIINQLLGHLWYRDRPFVGHHAILLLPASHDPSFPSDHAAFAFGIAVALFLAYWRLGGGALVLATLMSMARVFVGEHYPMDVLAGAAIGTLVALVLFSRRDRVGRLLDPVLRLVARVRLA
jgi:undecaprenyl-diphosphatase